MVDWEIRDATHFQFTVAVTPGTETVLSVLFNSLFSYGLSYHEITSGQPSTDGKDGGVFNADSGKNMIEKYFCLCYEPTELNKYFCRNT
jgi:hypothetical protein